MNDTKTLPVPGSHFIHLSMAVAMAPACRDMKEPILVAEYCRVDILPLSETYNRQHIDALPATKGCAGITIYYEMKDDLKTHAILVAIDGNNADICRTAPLVQRLVKVPL